MFTRYNDDPTLNRIEKLLEKLLAHFEGNPPEDRTIVNDISKNLKKIHEEKDDLRGDDFL